MFKSAKSHLLGIVLLSISTLFVNCQDGGSELPNELRGQAVLKGGNPAAHLKVGLYSVNYIPADSGSTGLSWTTRTDVSGHYTFKDIPPGRYNLVGIQDSLGFFRDSISISGDVSLGRDSLDKLGSLTGKIRLQPQHDPRNAVVQVMGTDIYFNVNADGRFTLSGLADGSYRIRVFVGLPNYVPLFKDIRVRAGMRDSLSTPLEPFFSGLPVVTGIQAVLDTARGIVKVTWHPVKYSALLTYLVYRDPANAVDLNSGPLNSTRILDSVYFDTLYRFDTSGRVLRGELGQAWEYRVRVKANNSDIGEAFEAAILNAVSPGIFETSIQIERLGDTVYPAFLGDTVRFVADYSNPSYTHRHLVWLNESLDTLRKVDLSAKSGSDTLTWVAPNRTDTTFLQVKITDANTQTWSESIPIQTGVSRVIGNINNPAGEVDAYAWNGKIVHVAQNEAGKLIIGLFDVTTRKDSTADSTASFVLPFGTTTYTPYSTAFSGGQLYLFHVTHLNFPGANFLSYDLTTGLWSRHPNVPGNVLKYGAIGSGGYLYVVTRAENAADTAGVYAFNTSAQVWVPKQRRLFSSYIRFSEYEGTIYLRNSLNGPFTTIIETYNPATDTWSPFPISPRFQWVAQSKMVGLNGKLYTFGGRSMTMHFLKAVDVFDPIQNAWSPAPDFLLARGFPGVVSLGSSIYIMGGQVMIPFANGQGSGSVDNSTVEEYRPE